MTELDIAEKMRRLRDEYNASLSERVSEIKQTFNRFGIDNDKHTLDELFRSVHRLSGSSSSFGYVCIHTLASNWEVLIQQSMHQYVKIDEATIAEFRKNIDVLSELAEQGPDQDIEFSLPEACGSIRQSDEQLSTVCLVEDDPFLRQDLSSQLEHLGFSVAAFPNKTEAEKALEKLQPDVFLIDVMLPEGDVAGPEFAEVVNNKYGYDKSIPTIFISSRRDWKTRLAAFRAGGAAYLTKPIDYLQLVKYIDQLTHRRLPEPYRILIVDDDQELAEYYALVLERAGMQAEVLSDPSEILHNMVSLKPDLVILDLYLPGISGMEVAGVLRQHPDLLSIPIVFLSSEHDRDVQLQALKQGDDFLQKPISDEQLIVAIRARSERSRILRELMYIDGLTGVLNHSALIKRLDDELRHSRRSNTPLSFVMLDLDNFKAINDEYGHPAGDFILKSLTRVLTGRLRATDQVGRYGGEEFAVILLDTPEDLALKIIDDLRHHFGNLMHSIAGTNVYVTFSAGVVQSRPEDSTDSLIQRSDERLYKAKRMGRNKVVATMKKN